MIVCLFSLWPCIAYSQEWQFDAATQKAYDLALNLQLDEAQKLLPNPKTAQEIYVVSLAEAIELLITEDAEKYQQYQSAHEERLGKRSKSSLAEDLFLQAEMRLQWTFVYLKFGHEFDAAWSLRQAYISMQDCRKRFPRFNAIKKTSGLLEIIVGSVPEKYNWVLGLLGMEGSVPRGIEELEAIRQSGHALSLEADLLYTLVQSFVFQKTDAAHAEIKKLLSGYPEHRLVNFLGAAVAIKNSRSEDALNMLNTLERTQKSYPLIYAYYLKGEVYLNKADYLNSISSYRWFINNYKGQNYLKDARFKIGLCYWLNGNRNDAYIEFRQAKNEGKEITEADKYAARTLAESELPNIPLSKARYYTDGGYYEEAQRILDSIRSTDIPTKRDQVEYYYRKARVAHKKEQLQDAKKFYQATIDANGESPWYFAPNACLQLGYLAVAENNTAAARTWFEKALTYEKHEYKNSIDSKAKTALAQLGKKK